MGQPKGLLLVADKPLLATQVEAFTKAGLPVLVVLGCRALDHIKILPPAIRVVLNLRWATTGMADSLEAALSLLEIDSVLVQPVDVPPPTSETITLLSKASGDAVACYQNIPGHPIRIGLPHRGRLDARLLKAQKIPVQDPDCIRNLNTPADFTAWCQGG
jgi:CTP:molybdopterin cytidylyltransferase MocA